MQFGKQRHMPRSKLMPHYADNTSTILTAESQTGSYATLSGIPDIVCSPATTRLETLTRLNTTEVAADDHDCAALVVAREEIPRKITSAKRLNALQVGLAAVAVCLAVYVPLHWQFWVWAVVELGLILHVARACRSYRTLLYLIQVDLARGSVRESEGRVCSFGIFWRAVEDSESGDLYLIVAPLANPSSVPLGSCVTYRAAIRSRIVLSLKGLVN